METLHAQKENVDAGVRGSGTNKVNFAEKFSTPKHGFVLHNDSKSTGKKGLKARPSKKSRRVLSDISNKQDNRRHGHNSDNISGVKKTSQGKKGLGHSKEVNAKKKTPLNKKGTASLKPETVIKPPHVEEVPEIELAYGGLPSPKSNESAYLKEVHDEIVRDILNDNTPTLFDDFDPLRAGDDWDDDCEKAMLASGEPPSPWWSLTGPENLKEPDNNFATNEDEVEDDLSDLPPPDNLPDDAAASIGDDGLLEDILSVDVEAACSE